MDSSLQPLLFYGSQLSKQSAQSEIHKIASSKKAEVISNSVEDFFSDSNVFYSLRDKFFNLTFSDNSTSQAFRIFYLQDLEAISENQKKYLSKEQLKQSNLNELCKIRNNFWVSLVSFLVTALSQNSSSDLLVLQAKTNSLTIFPNFLLTSFKKNTKPHFIELPTSNDKIVLWTKHKLAVKGIDLTLDLVQILVYFCDENLELLDQEIEKLSLLKVNNNITKEVILQLVSNTKTHTIFELIANIFKKKTLQVVRGLDYFFRKEAKDMEQLLFSLLIKDLQRILKIRWLLESNWSLSKIAANLQIPLWLIQKTIQNAKLLRTNEISNALLFLQDNDLAIKYSNKGEITQQACLLITNGYFAKHSY